MQFIDRRFFQVELLPHIACVVHSNTPWRSDAASPIPA
jgi:hypothetical protein